VALTVGKPRGKRNIEPVVAGNAKSIIYTRPINIGRKSSKTYSAPRSSVTIDINTNTGRRSVWVISPTGGNASAVISSVMGAFWHSGMNFLNH